MLKYKLIEENSEYITYAYYPEGREYFGVVKMRKRDEEVLEKKLAKNDSDGWYALHMIWKIEDLIAENNFRKNGMMAWY